MKKIGIALLLLAAMLLTALCAPAASLPFTDVEEGRWSYDYIDWCYQNGIFQGKNSSDTFCPTDNITRAEFVTVLGRYAESLGGAYQFDGFETTGFSDVPQGKYYSKYVAWAFHYEIVKGTSATTFSPDVLVTREQFVTFIYRFLKSYIGINADRTASELNFPDTAQISAFARSATAAANGLGIVVGRDNGNFDPKANATREVAARIMNALDTCIKDFFADSDYVFATREGVVPNTGADASAQFQQLVNDLPAGKTLCFAGGRYIIDASVLVKDKNDIAIDGNGATLVKTAVALDPVTGGELETTECFIIRDSADITVSNFNLDTASHEFIGGTVTDAVRESYVEKVDGRNVTFYRFYLYYTIDDGYQCTGDEVICQIVTLDENGKTDGALMAGNSLILERPYTDAQETYLGDNKWRLELNLSDVDNIAEFNESDRSEKMPQKQFGYAGQRVEISVLDRTDAPGRYTFRHGTGIKLDTVDTCLLEGIHIYSGSFGLTGLNYRLTLQSCSIKPENTNTGLACDVTGVWGIPTRDYMHIYDCEFWGFGDDEINLFSRQTCAYNIDTDAKTLYTYNSYDQWEDNVVVGDLIKAYDPNTLEYHGSFTVTAVHYKEGSKLLEYEPCSDFNVKNRDTLDNNGVHTQTEIKRCTFLNGRVRSILYQASNITVEDCLMECPMQLISDYDAWSEGGMVNNVIVRGCTFQNIGTRFFGSVYGKPEACALDIDCCPTEATQNGEYEMTPRLYNNYLIENNTFSHVQQLGIDIAYCTDVTIRNNTFLDCGWGTTSRSYRFRPAMTADGPVFNPNGMMQGNYQYAYAIYDWQYYQIYVQHCTGVLVENNRYDTYVTGTPRDEDGNNNDMYFLKFATDCIGCEEKGSVYTGD